MARVSFRLQKSTGGSGLRTDVARSYLAAGAMTAASATLDVTGGVFTDLDIGASISVTGAGTAGATLESTIVSITDSNTVVLGDVAVLTVSGEDVTIFADDTDGLRADALQVAPATLLGGDTYFEAVSTCYGEVSLEWDLPLVSTLTAEPQPTQYVVVYSPFGSPETIPSGEVVAEGSTANAATHTGLPEGRFAFYSLFVRYQSTGGDNYYEKVASLEEIVPRNFQSTLDMWNRIPSYYRERDVELGALPNADKLNCLGFDTYGEPVGPLLTFLSIFGFEMDRVRTLAQHVPRSKDPYYADTSALDYLADELGTLLDLDDLGASRLRSLLDSIGVFRRIKGTEQGTEYFLKSATGNDIVLDSATRTVEVSSGRINHITDPRDVNSTIESTTGPTLFGKGESAGYIGDTFVASTSYQQSTLLAEGQYAVSTPGLVNAGTGTTGTITYTGVTEAAGPQTYTGTADPDVIIPAGHMFAINNNSALANKVTTTITGTEFDLVNKGGTMVAGAVFTSTVAGPPVDMSMLRVGGGSSEYFRLTWGSTGRLKVTFKCDFGVLTTLDTGFSPNIDTLYYMIAYINEDWSTIYCKVYDSTGEVASASQTMASHLGAWTPIEIYHAQHPGGLEMSHFSTGEHADRTWANAASIAAEWITGTRTAAGGTVYTLDSPITVSVGDTVSFSVHSGVGVMLTATTSNIAWARLVDTSTGLVIHGYQDAMSLRYGVPYFDIPVTVAGTCEVQFMVEDNSIFDSRYYLLERNSTGPYFDGDLVRGGWILGSSTSISDYRWEGGSANANNARSLYSEDYERTRQVTEGLYEDVFPVHLLGLWDVTWNNG